MYIRVRNGASDVIRSKELIESYDVVAASAPSDRRPGGTPPPKVEGYLRGPANLRRDSATTSMTVRPGSRAADPETQHPCWFQDLAAQDPGLTLHNLYNSYRCT